MNIVLKPCPFCGGRASVYDWQSVVGIGCSDEDCPGSMLSEWCFSTTYDAAEAWNTRAERTCRIRGGECDQCGAHIHEHAVLYWVPVGEGMRTVESRAVRFCPSCGAKVVEG